MLPILPPLSIALTGTCPSGASTSTSIDVFVGTSTVSTTCTGSASPYTFSTTLAPSATQLASDGTLSLVLDAVDGSSTIATAALLDQSFATNTIQVAASDWMAASSADTNSLTLQFPALSTGQSATGDFDVAGLHKGELFALQPSTSASAAAGATSMILTAPYAPVTADNYGVTEGFGNNFSNAGHHPVPRHAGFAVRLRAEAGRHRRRHQHGTGLLHRHAAAQRRLGGTYGTRSSDLPAPTTPATSSYHTLMATTNAPLNPASVGAGAAPSTTLPAWVPRIGIR